MLFYAESLHGLSFLLYACRPLMAKVLLLNLRALQVRGTVLVHTVCLTVRQVAELAKCT